MIVIVIVILIWLEGGAFPTNVTRELTTSLVFLLRSKLVYRLYRLYSGYSTVDCTSVQSIVQSVQCVN